MSLKITQPHSGVVSSLQDNSAGIEQQLGRASAKLGAEERVEFDACGVGFIGSKGAPGRYVVDMALRGLKAVEHRGARAADNKTTDGIGVMLSIPHKLLGISEGTAVGQCFLPLDSGKQRESLDTLCGVLRQHGLSLSGIRTVPTNPEALGPIGQKTRPGVFQIFIARPAALPGDEFEARLYSVWRDAEQLAAAGSLAASFCSLSTNRLVYKALCTAIDFDQFYPDLLNPEFESSFALFHRRFSTNTTTSWSRAQPFMFVAHNGEINTIAANRTMMAAREQQLGLPIGSLLTAGGLSDSGSLDQSVAAIVGSGQFSAVKEALGGKLSNIVKALIPPSGHGEAWLESKFEPWDGPALISFCDGTVLGARLDRNGFRPFHVVETTKALFACSEAGAFALDGADIVRKFRLGAGESIWMEPGTGNVTFDEARPLHPGKDTVVHRVPAGTAAGAAGSDYQARARWYAITSEEITEILSPMILTGKEGIGSMGDTARLAAVSTEPRAFGDFLYQSFAQVTNPPIDFLREREVTDLRMFLHGKGKDLLQLSSPVLTPSQLDWVVTHTPAEKLCRVEASVNAESSLSDWVARVADEVTASVANGAETILLSDAAIVPGGYPVPGPLAVGAIEHALKSKGLLGRAALIVESGDIKSAHEAAMTISAGATAVAPSFAFEVASKLAAEKGVPEEQAVENLRTALTEGVLKIMSKVGISVARSYRGSRLFTPMGLAKEVSDLLGGPDSPVGGLSLAALDRHLRMRSQVGGDAALPHLRLFREDLRGGTGERHEMTQKTAKHLHGILSELRLSSPDVSRAADLYREYISSLESSEPVALRHFLELKKLEQSAGAAEIQSRDGILATFGSGAISFGAIGKFPQRDIFRAMQIIGGRSNSGEGGENPLYYKDGTTASTKQIASAHFGVSADYLNRGTREVQIKIGQGAKPGEGGQLMGVKVSVEIAQARHARPGQDLISPPPLHDIYSIEDLAQKIRELRIVAPQAKISVKLVAGANIGTIAVGVAKCGADTIHIAGHDGGTGAAGLLSMKHTGLPWEVGLSEAHRALVEEGVRDRVTLRVDGGLRSGRDVVVASILGADEFDFGKLLLVGQGCLFLRVCQTNKCSPGIATQDPKLEAKYESQQHDRAQDIANLLRIIAEDARRTLAEINATSLAEVRGKVSLLEARSDWKEHLVKRGVDFGRILSEPHAPIYSGKRDSVIQAPRERAVVGGDETVGSVFWGQDVTVDTGKITPEYQAFGAWSAGALARRVHVAHLDMIRDQDGADLSVTQPRGVLTLTAQGSAGQSFGVFCRSGMRLVLHGEANDSVAKSMSGGEIHILPDPKLALQPESVSIIGNVAMYGATGGTLYVHGKAGDRFAVRNSGGTAVVEGVGMHGCEYMTSGSVIILGSCGKNLGSGMTGGLLFVAAEECGKLTGKGLVAAPCTDEQRAWLVNELKRYHSITGSLSAYQVLAELAAGGDPLVCVEHESTRALRAAPAHSESDAAANAEEVPAEEVIAPKNSDVPPAVRAAARR